ncbi:hypothetical protein WMY93_003557 [Mugilogobius chulae]|uniref:Folate receptor-like domain-containing protein n=1 Tax=Mugilogobius chulae TaxID=88201 RepID=A0AAW0Q2N5_9GOBI
MGITLRCLLPLCCILAGVLICGAYCDGVCLQDGKHKAVPSPEPHLQECSLYADNSCCTEEHIQDISHVPTASNKNEPWDKCGPLSPEPPGQNCTGSCVSYQQMYQHGRDLCESLWGEAFVTVEDEPEDLTENTGAPCGCLTLTASDRDKMAALRAQQDDPEELDTTKTGLPQYRAPCQAVPPLAPHTQRRANSVLRKRSVMDDGEGSGSGLDVEKQPGSPTQVTFSCIKGDVHTQR